MSKIFQNLKEYLVAKEVPHHEEENGRIKIFPRDIERPEVRSHVMSVINSDGVEKVETSDDFVVFVDVADGERIVFSLNGSTMSEDRILVKEQAAAPEDGAAFSGKKEVPNAGIVIKVGPGNEKRVMYLKEGCKIIYGKWAGTEIEIDGEVYLVMRQSDVLMWEPVLS